MFAFKLKTEIGRYSVFDLSRTGSASAAGRCPRTRCPADMTDQARDADCDQGTASAWTWPPLLLNDFRLHLRVLEHHPAEQRPPPTQKMRESFKHWGPSPGPGSRIQRECSGLKVPPPWHGAEHDRN